MQTRNIVLNVSKLRKTYLDSNHEVLSGVSLKIYEEDFLCVLGPSGCGKSTIIRCIAGFEKYDGIIECNGRKVTKPGTDRIMVFQDFAQLFPWKTVEGNITYPLKVNGMSDKTERKRVAREYLNIVDLNEFCNFYPHQLSGGMKQRVAIARGLALQPRLILMDEPFASLDAISRNQMQAEVMRIKEKTHMTVIFITHNIQEAISLGNRIVVMSKNGEIREEITNSLEKPVTPATKGYGELWIYLNSLLNEGQKQ